MTTTAYEEDETVLMLLEKFKTKINKCSLSDAEKVRFQQEYSKETNLIYNENVPMKELVEKMLEQKCRTTKVMRTLLLNLTELRPAIAISTDVMELLGWMLKRIENMQKGPKQKGKCKGSGEGGGVSENDKLKSDNADLLNKLRQLEEERNMWKNKGEESDKKWKSIIEDLESTVSNQDKEKHRMSIQIDNLMKEDVLNLRRQSDLEEIEKWRKEAMEHKEMVERLKEESLNAEEVEKLQGSILVKDEELTRIKKEIIKLKSINDSLIEKNKALELAIKLLQKEKQKLLDQEKKRQCKGKGKKKQHQDLLDLPDTLEIIIQYGEPDCKTGDTLQGKRPISPCQPDCNTCNTLQRKRPISPCQPDCNACNTLQRKRPISPCQPDCNTSNTLQRKRPISPCQPDCNTSNTLQRKRPISPCQPDCNTCNTLQRKRPISPCQPDCNTCNTLQRKRPISPCQPDCNTSNTLQRKCPISSCQPDCNTINTQERKCPSQCELSTQQKPNMLNQLIKRFKDFCWTRTVRMDILEIT